MNGFESRNTVVMSIDEVKFFVNNYVFSLVVSSLQFIDESLALLRKKDFYLLFWEFRPFE